MIKTVPKKQTDSNRGVSSVPTPTPREAWSANYLAGQKRSLGMIGVDIGSIKTKIAQVETTRDCCRIVAAHCVDTPTDFVQESGQFFAQISKVIRLGPFRNAPVSCLLPNDVYSVQRLHSSARSDEKVIEEIKASCERQQNVTARESAIEFWELPPASNQDLRHFITVAVRRELVNRLSMSAWKQGLDLAIVDSPLFAAARLAISEDENSCVIDWGTSSTRVTMFQNGIPAFVRELRSTGVELVIEAVANQLNTTPLQASHLMRRVGLTPISPSLSHEFAEALIGIRKRISDEFARTRNYCEQKLRLELPERITLIGGGACFPGAQAWLEGCQIPNLQNWSPLQRPLESSAVSHEMGLFANALSLSLIPSSQEMR